jgi:hypothetical protein
MCGLDEREAGAEKRNEKGAEAGAEICIGNDGDAITAILRRITLVISGVRAGTVLKMSRVLMESVGTANDTRNLTDTRETEAHQ